MTDRAAIAAAVLDLMQMQQERPSGYCDDFDRLPAKKRQPAKPKPDPRANVKAARKQRNRK